MKWVMGGVVMDKTIKCPYCGRIFTLIGARSATESGPIVVLVDDSQPKSAADG